MARSRHFTYVVSFVGLLISEMRLACCNSAAFRQTTRAHLLDYDKGYMVRAPRSDWSDRPLSPIVDKAGWYAPPEGNLNEAGMLR